MRVTVGGWLDHFAEDNYPCRAAVYAQGAACADVVVDGENDLVVGVDARQFGVDGIVDGVWGDHENALPGANVDAAFAHDAFGLINMYELLGLDSLFEPVSVDFLQDIVVAELRHRGIGFGDSHFVRLARLCAFAA